MRARKFYGLLFGWKIKKFPGVMDYWHIDTGGGNDTPDGGLMARKCPEEQGITRYVRVESVDKSAAKVQKLGGKICRHRAATPQMGSCAICQDSEQYVCPLGKERKRKTDVLMRFAHSS